MDDSSSTTLRCQLPKQSLTAVEYPGFVRDADKAVAKLGGEENIPTSSEGELLRLTLRHQPFAHALFADVKPSKSLLLRISRPRQVDPDSLVPCKMEVVGVVQTTMQFNGMADYQFLPVDNTYTARDFSKSPMENLPEKAEPSGVVQPLFCVPPLFSKLDLPFDYAYKQYNFQDPKAKATKATVVSYYAASVPPAVPAPAETVQGSEAAPLQQPAHVTTAADYEARLSDLLRQRPIWSYQMLAHQLGHSHFLQVMLAKLTYKFKTGPWRALHIRRGYDPRQQASSRPYQGITYTLPDAWYEQGLLSAAPVIPAPARQRSTSDPPPAATAAASAPSSAASGAGEVSITSINAFQVLPTTRTTLLQVCDLQDPAIQALCAAGAGQDVVMADAGSADAAEASAATPPPGGPVCHETYGWFSPADWSTIVQAVDHRFNQVIKTMPKPQPQQPATREAAGGAAGAEAASAEGSGGRGAGRGGRGDRGRKQAAGRTGRPRGRPKGSGKAASKAADQSQPDSQAAASQAEEPHEEPAAEAVDAQAGTDGGTHTAADMLQQMMQRVQLNQPPFGLLSQGGDDGDDAYELLEQPGSGQPEFADSLAAMVAADLMDVDQEPGSKAAALHTEGAEQEEEEEEEEVFGDDDDDDDDGEQDEEGFDEEDELNYL